MESSELNGEQLQPTVSQETDVTALLESAMSAGSEQLAAEYQIRQVDGGGPGGQILDCKVDRDEQTGLPRVEMIFSISPSQQDPQFTLLQGATTSDDISTSSTTDLASPADLQSTNPPDTLFRSAATPVSGVRVSTTPPPSGLQQNDVSSSSSGKRMDAEDERLFTAWKKWMERRSGLKRAILFASQVLDWHDDRDPLIIVGFITILLLLLRSMSSSVLTSVGLIGFILCLFELIRLRPGVEDYINSIANISEDEERQLNSTYEQLFNAKRRLLDATRETIELRNDRPVAFMLIMISCFFLLTIIGQYMDAITLLYVSGLVAALLPGVLKRDFIGKIGLRRLIDEAKKIK